jgi:hypothetical protein
MGLPVVATDVPGCRHVIEDGVNGLLCAPRDTASLKRALVRMLTLSEPERDALGAQGRSVVEERFSESAGYRRHCCRHKYLLTALGLAGSLLSRGAGIGKGCYSDQ